MTDAATALDPSDIIGSNPEAMTYQQALLAEIAEVLDRIDPVGGTTGFGHESADPVDYVSRLGQVAQTFALSRDATEILALAVGCELDSAIAARVGALAGVERLTVDLAISLYSDEALDALCPESALRRWRLVELVGTGPFHTQQLIVDERLVHHLVGISYLDSRLAGIVHRQWPDDAITATLALSADAMARTWARTEMTAVVRLGGRDRGCRRSVAAAAADAVGYHLLRIDASDIPTDWTQRHGLATFADREMALSKAVTLIETDADHAAAAARFGEALLGPVIISSADPPMVERSPVIRIDLTRPDVAERRAVWNRAVATLPVAPADDRLVDRLAEQFGSDPATVDAAVASTLTQSTLTHRGDTQPGQQLWQAAREQSRRSLDTLADRIESDSRWSDLVLPVEQLSQLHDLAAHVAESWRVNTEWGWGGSGRRGLGAATLFAGPSGTGKTLAAEVIACELGLDLYRIDLSQILSKWIGETEKNLATIFDAADDAGAVLLFDEADALFAKRTDVKDSHDRYANVEVSYLLQRMEDYSGLAILTTNLRASIDRAFLRRLRYVVTFPFPDTELRAEIWARVFPSQTPTVGLDPTKLARLNLAGGSIRSIALNAAYLAAGAGQAVGIDHIMVAARREYEKMDKRFGSAEIGALT